LLGILRDAKIEVFIVGVLGRQVDRKLVGFAGAYAFECEVTVAVGEIGQVEAVAVAGIAGAELDAGALQTEAGFVAYPSFEINRVERIFECRGISSSIL
jgi:hypothetical protein